MKKMLTLALALGLVATHGALRAEGSIAAGKAKSAPCAACHGVDGNSANPLWPKLAGQVPEYLVKQLKDFKSGARKDPLMSGQAAGLATQDMQDLAAYYSTQKVALGTAQADKQTIARGERLYRGGNAKFGVSACMSCHGPSGHGIPPKFPRVSAQHPAYTEKQMLAFKNDERTNDDDIMTRTAFRMSAEEIKAVSQYMSGLH
ncbi:MAG TPA: c-type cytochrome [Acidiferrobacterales bacterium]|jgi:cytochrome c553